MKKITILTATAFIITCLLCVTAWADEPSAQEQIKKQMELYELDKYDMQIKSSVGEIEGIEGKSFSDIVFGALNGELNLSFAEVVKIISGALFKEVFDNLSIMRNLIVVAILAAALNSLGNAFFENSVGKIGSYIIYISLITLLVSSFVSSAQLAGDVISKLAAFMQALLPLIMALLIAAGRYSVSFVFHPATMGVVQIATYVINSVVMNIIIFAAIVQMVNFMLPKGTLDYMTEFFSKVIGSGLKWISLGFMAVLSIQTVSAPIVGGLVGKGAKLAVGAIPVVGQAFTGAVDSVLYWGDAMKNGVAVGSIIFVAFICFMPILKLCAIVLIYKLTAAIIQPIAEERIVGCIDAAGNFTALFIGAVMSVAVMFVVLLMMVVAAAMG